MAKGKEDIAVCHLKNVVVALNKILLDSKNKRYLENSQSEPQKTSK